MMSKMLKKIKLSKNAVVLEYQGFVQVGENIFKKDNEEICEAPPTAEFKAAIKQMEYFVGGIVPFDERKVETLVVTQIGITDEDDGLGIVMSVTAKFKKSSRPLNFNTPYWSTLDNENPLPEAAVEAVETIREQAKAYSGGVYEQTTLDLTTDKEISDPNAPEKAEEAEKVLDGILEGSEESEDTPGIARSTGNLNVEGALENMREQPGVNGRKPRRKRRTKLEMEKARAEKQEAAEATV